MHLLLDTHILLWAAADSPRLSQEARELLLDPEHQLAYSAASLWEITIKRGLGRDDFRVEPSVLRRELMEHGYEELAIRGPHTLAVGNLPDVHKDPFDRMLVAQAQVEGYTLLTRDHQVAQYPGPIRLV
ncbi:type II toxin-antitoxin system VapC family toxin [Halorhodospira halophila]|uniref:PilT protein domain protein n=1 Tax=Halorhodospira halophila (strain DSM 244 / SL1) TaxID=349124 RepID=A1WV53_HALHL|nr:type II toxin-antitoxin system VapC family toxin [Halorhodospira halophila]ABM61565.1 PilT protein domain protein [Halorhodospira halophila SL1]MBK1728812.1 PIN domain nuclease [Halorhodospira halophila]